MKHTNDPSQLRMFDEFEGIINSVGRRHIEQGWQGLFREVILARLPVEELGKEFCDDNGRPTAELYSMLGLLLIRQFMGWTMPQAHEAILFRTDIQYALNLPPGFEVSQRTIERYSRILHDHDSISQETFLRITDDLIARLEINVKKQRLDSTHVLSDMAMLGRAQLLGVALRRFFKQLENYNDQLLLTLDAQLLGRYRKQSDSRIFGDLRTGEERQAALQQGAEDLYKVLLGFKDNPTIVSWKLYQQMSKIFEQQCELRETFLTLKDKPGGNILINPSDDDATFSGHKGGGYQVQISETYNDSGEPNLITAAKVETAVQSDQYAVEPVLEDLQRREILPEELAADAGYGGDDNVEFAKTKDVELLSPVPGGKKPSADKLGYQEFELNDANELVVCPAGHEPKSTRFNSKEQYVWAQMDPALCQACPLLERCRVQRKSKSSEPTGRLQFDLRSIRSDCRRAYQRTDQFKERYRKRSGIEGTNSCLKRKLGLGRLRVRGMKAVSSAILLKLTGWNILRAVAVRLHRNQAQKTVAI